MPFKANIVLILCHSHIVKTQDRQWCHRRKLKGSPCHFLYSNRSTRKSHEAPIVHNSFPWCPQPPVISLSQDWRSSMYIPINIMTNRTFYFPDRTNNSRKSIEFMTKAMEKSSRFMQVEQYHLINVYSYLALGDLEGAEKAIESAMEHHSKSILLKVCN